MRSAPFTTPPRPRRRRWPRVLAVLGMVAGVVAVLLWRGGGKQPQKEEIVIVDLAPPPPPPPPPPPEEEAPETPEEMDQAEEIAEADAPDELAEDTSEALDLGIDAGDLATGPGGGDFLVGLPRGGGGGGRGQGGGMLDAVDAPPTAISKIQPTYPSSLLRKGIGGKVLVSCTVDAGGRVVSSTIKQSAHPDLDKAALAAVAKWRFKPANRGGRDVQARCVIPFHFEIKKP